MSSSFADDTMNMQTLRKKLLAVSPPSQFPAHLVGALKPHFDIQLASSLDMALFLLKEWEPELVLVEMITPLDQLAIQSSQYFADPEKCLIALCTSVSGQSDKYHKWNVAGVIETTDSPERTVFQICSISNKISKLCNKVSPETKDEPASFKEFLGLKVYENDFIVKRGDQVLTTTPTQFKLLMAFTNHPDQLLSRHWIKEQVWQNSDISPRSIDAQISKLKKLLPELDGALMNIYGKGYILAEPGKKAA